MSNPDKLGLAKRSLRVLTNNLREGDTVALATYAGRVAKVLEPTGVEHRERILSALDNLEAGGSTAMNSGLEVAYELAMENFRRDHVNRVVVLSDGDANVGPASHEQILDRIQHFVDEGVSLSTIGFGMGNYQDTMMEQLANNGNGNYYYVDSMDEAQRIFGRQVDGTLQTIAKDVKIQVEFDEKAVSKYRLVGYENRHVADEDFRNENVDAGEIGAGHTVTAFYEIRVEDQAALTEDGVTVRVRHKPPQGVEAREQAFALDKRHLHGHLNQASQGFRFGASVTAFAEILRDSPYAEHVSLDLVEEVASSSAGEAAERREFLRLVRKAQNLSARRR
jgi:Ca-activated chloride channel family protein